MKDLLLGMALGASIASALCCPKMQEVMKCAEKKMKEVMDAMTKKKNDCEPNCEKQTSNCECGCDCVCHEEELY